MKRHLLRARRLSLCATAAGLCIAGLSIAQTTAHAAPETVRVSPEHGRANTFLGSIVSGGASSWASRSSWETVFRAGVPSFYGAEFVSFTPYSSGISSLIELSPNEAAIQPMLRGFGGVTITDRGAQLTRPSVGTGGAVKFGAGTLQIGSFGGTTATSPASVVNSGSLTLNQGASAPVSTTVINVTGSNGQNDVQVGSAGTADVVTAPPPPAPPRPVIRPRPPTPPRPPVVSR